MHPALGVDDVGERCRCHRRGNRPRLLDQRVDIGFVGQQELDVVAARPAQVAAAVLVGQVAELADGRDRQKAGRSGAHREQLVAGLGHVHHHARVEDLVVVPLAVVVLDDRGRNCS